MSRKCVLCTTHKSCKEKVSFYSFPKTGVYKDWLLICGVTEDQEKEKKLQICNKCFEPDCFTGDFDKFGRKVLKPDAVPSRKITFGESKNSKRLAETPTEFERPGKKICEIPKTVFLSSYQDFCEFIRNPEKCVTVLCSSSLLIELNTKISTYQNFLNQEKQMNKRRAGMIENLKVDLKKKISNDNLLEVKKLLGEVSSELLERAMSNAENKFISRKECPEKLRIFAVTLHYKSPAAYRFVRETFLNALPSEKTIFNWYKRVDCSPGTMNESLRFLDENCKEPEPFSLIFDDMSIMKKIEKTGTSITGAVDLGDGEFNEVEASDAFCLMVNSFRRELKMFVGYYFIKGMDAEGRHDIVVKTIRRLFEKNVLVVNVTCDGAPTNIAVLKRLGAGFDFENPKVWFPHPEDSKIRVFVTLDPIHMMKLVRNNFSAQGILLSPSGEEIKWEHIKTLHELQVENQLRLGNKLTSMHVNFKNHKMKSSLALQVLSKSVGDSLKICQTQSLIQSSEGTMEFCYMFNEITDFMNSRNVNATGSKAPLKLDEKGQLEFFITKAKMLQRYIYGLKKINGQRLVESKQYTGFFGLFFGMESALGLADQLLQNPPPNFPKQNFLLTYDLCQDKIEHSFSIIRSRGGFNNNPTVRMFNKAMKGVLLNAEIRISSGNCAILDKTLKQTHFFGENTPATSLEISDDDFEYLMTMMSHDISEFKKAAIGYISGFIVSRLESRLCSICFDSCKANSNSTHPTAMELFHLKQRGPLIMPSYGVVETCILTENAMNLLSKNIDSIQLKSHLEGKVLNMVVRHADPYKLFPSFESHHHASEFESPLMSLIKAVAAMYYRIKRFHLIRVQNDKNTGGKVRQKLNKITLFKHV